MEYEYFSNVSDFIKIFKKYIIDGCSRSKDWNIQMNICPISGTIIQAGLLLAIRNGFMNSPCSSFASRGFWINPKQAPSTQAHYRIKKSKEKQEEVS